MTAYYVRYTINGVTCYGCYRADSLPAGAVIIEAK